MDAFDNLSSCASVSPGTGAAPRPPGARTRTRTWTRTWAVLGGMVALALALLALYAGLQMLGGLIVHWAGPAVRSSTLVAIELVICGIIIVGYRMLVRLIERRAAGELAFDRSALLLCWGVLAGVALFAAIYAIFWAGGIARYDGFYGFDGMPPAFAISIASAVGEELIVRGAVFRRLEDAFGTLAALLFSAALFGLLHGLNPGSTWVSTVSVALEAGLLLGLAYTAARTLWFPIGIHFGWNFTEGGIVGAAVSGFDLHGVLRIPLSGPDILTGGSFGPEASLVAVAVCLAGSVLLGWAAVRRGRWRSWRMARAEAAPAAIAPTADAAAEPTVVQ